MVQMTKGRCIDVSDRSLLTLVGDDGLDLLQRISTNDLSKLAVGEHVETVLTTEKGRIEDVIQVLRASANVIILSGRSNDGSRLRSWIERFIVMEDAKIDSVANSHFQILIFNLQDDELTTELNDLKISGLHTLNMDRNQIMCIAESACKDRLKSLLLDKGIVITTEEEYQDYRIRNGIPAYPNEISSQFNPIEVGFGSLVSFSKGCYVGQEVIARLDTYQKSQRILRRLMLSGAPLSLPEPLLTEESEIAGVLTSCTKTANPNQGLHGIGIISPKYVEKQMKYSCTQGEFEGRAEALLE